MNTHEKKLVEISKKAYQETGKPTGIFVGIHQAMLIDLSGGFDAMKKAIGGGYIEPVYLQSGNMMIVDEDGLMKGLPFNAHASAVAGFDIVGMAVFVPARWKTKSLGSGKPSRPRRPGGKR